ncbi:hypothetical protein ACEYW6_22870 [Nostoc sp. UIC 10607]|uniref:hypothetical protein n=1 Tax=Nostoc sp. UIC 10607 TaxID=3045935 RepID=UPI00399FE3EC
MARNVLLAFRVLAIAFGKKIAGLLKISIKIFKSQQVQLMKRLDIYDIVGLLRYAVPIGLVTFDN